MTKRLITYVTVYNYGDILPYYPKEHEDHLCYRVAKKGLLMEEGLTTLKNLTSEANYICVTCGRVAKAAESLCHPFKL